MSSTHQGGNIQPSLDLEEHASKGAISAKKVVPHAYDAATDTFTPALSGGLLPMPYSDLEFSNPDSNGNYQTLVVKSGSTAVATLTFVYDANNNATSITRS